MTAFVVVRPAHFVSPHGSPDGHESTVPFAHALRVTSSVGFVLPAYHVMSVSMMGLVVDAAVFHALTVSVCSVRLTIST